LRNSEAEAADGDKNAWRPTRPKAFCIRVDWEARRFARRLTFFDLLAAILRGRRSNSRIAFQATAGGGDGYAVVLDFDLLPRTRSAKKSMEETDLGVLAGLVPAIPRRMRSIRPHAAPLQENF
jgi:hypothetical protein